MMNRRGFLSLGLGALATAALAPLAKLLPKRAVSYRATYKELGYESGATFTELPPSHPNCRCVVEPIIDLGETEQALTELWGNYRARPDRIMMSEAVASRLIELGYDPHLFTADENGVYYLGDIKPGKRALFIRGGNARDRRKARRATT